MNRTEYLLTQAASECNEGLGTNAEDDDCSAPPRVTDAPADVWLVYGDLDRDSTHLECCRSGDVGWCEDKQYDSDVHYVRGDRYDELRTALSELRDRLKAHPAYADLTEEEEMETGGDTAELSYLARVADAALGA
jgi:hypothetical protein